MYIDEINNIDEVDFYLVDLKSRFDKIEPNTYYLSYSGGKDSHFLYWFIKEYLKRDDIKIIGVNTYMEHHQIRDRIFKNCDEVLLPDYKPMHIKARWGIPCFSKMQDGIIEKYQRGSRAKSTMMFVDGVDKEGNKKVMYKLNNMARAMLVNGYLHPISNKCCKYLKKEPARKYQERTGLKPILGVRAKESLLRKAVYKSCFTKDMTFTPIWDLSDELMDKIYEKYNIEIPEIYNHVSRTGCMGCPYGSYKHDTERELALINENQFNFVCEYFKESYEVLGIDPEKCRNGK